MKKPIIELQSYEFSHLSRVKESSEEKIEPEITFNIEYNELLKLTNLQLRIELKFNSYKINVEIEGNFKIKDPSMDFERIKNVLSVNGIAILYPYLRSAVSILTSIDSEESLLLPTINTSIFDENFKD